MKHELAFVELHNPLFMMGCNLGVKINAMSRGCRLFWDDSLDTFGIYFKGKFTGIGSGNVASYDFQVIPEDVKEFLGLNEPQEEKPAGPPAVSRARRGRPPMEPIAEMTDPNDPEAHRAAVRAASANANKPDPAMGAMRSEQLIQQAREAAMHAKNHDAKTKQ